MWRTGKMAIIPISPEREYPAWFEPAAVAPESWTPHMLGADALALIGYESSVYVGQREADLDRMTHALVVADHLMRTQGVVRAELTARAMDRQYFV
jgi:hypothetical protein